MSRLLRVGVLASGRGSNLQALLDAGSRADYPARVVVVVSDREEVRGGRGHDLTAMPSEQRLKFGPAIQLHRLPICCLRGQRAGAHFTIDGLEPEPVDQAENAGEVRSRGSDQ